MYSFYDTKTAIGKFFGSRTLVSFVATLFILSTVICGSASATTVSIIKDGVEETVVRICYAYGMKSIDVFSVISMIQATVVDEQDVPHTQMRRIYSNQTDFGRLEKLNALSRKICANVPDVAVARQELEQVTKKDKQYLSTDKELINNIEIEKSYASITKSYDFVYDKYCSSEY